jgi:hypothetical protein
MACTGNDKSLARISTRGSLYRMIQLTANSIFEKRTFVVLTQQIREPGV